MAETPRPASAAREDLRYEVKMIAHASAYGLARHSLRLDTAGVRVLHPPRRVQSVYFDTLDQSAMHENLSGVSHREKLRFRWYGDSARGVTGRLERKVRENMLGWKDVVAVPGPLDVEGATRSELMRAVFDHLPAEWAVARAQRLGPVQWISYSREYFATANGTHQICSDTLFAVNATTGQHQWRYEHGLILNSTIAASDDRVYFLECRNQEVRDRPARRIAAVELWPQIYLVSLDTRTGEVLAEQPLTAATGHVACYLAHSNQHLVLVTSANKSYHVYAHSADTCDQLWEATFPWGKGKADHGSHLSRPAIVGDRVFVRPAVLDLESGQRLPISIPVGGCGTYAATESALFFRAGSGKNSAVWDSKTGEYTTWSRLRPDCWLSTIPAGGMLLSPEGGGGCSCGSWLETSIGFMPIQNAVAKLPSLKPE